MAVLGVENYGVWTFAKTHVMFYLIAVMLGFNTVGTREIAKDVSQMPKYVNTIITLRLLSSILAYGLMAVIVFSTLVGEEVKQIVVLISGIKIISDANMLNWVFDGLQKMHINAVRSIVTSVIGTFGIVLLVKEPDQIILAAWIMSIAFAANTIWMLIYYAKEYYPIHLELDIVFIKKLLKSAIPIGIAFFIIQLYNSLDSQMLEYMFSDKSKSNYFNGVYGAAHQVVLAAMIPSGILQGAFFPQFAQKYKIKEEFDSLMRNYSTMTFLIGIFGGMLIFFFASDFVDMLTPNEFAETAPILQYLAFTILITYVNISYFAPLIAAGKEREVLWANAAGLLFNAVCNFILIPEYNVYGAAVATIASEIGVLILLIFMFKKYFGKLYLAKFVKLFFICTLSIIPAGMKYLMEINFIFLILACILFFVIFNFLFGTISIKEIKGLIKR